MAWQWDRTKFQVLGLLSQDQVFLLCVDCKLEARGFLDEALAEVCRKATLSVVSVHGQPPPLSRLPCGSARNSRGRGSSEVSP